ncbi:Gfo/Idh/MocA family oxidoreductase [Palleronia sediminis]|uniref:Gfo/Idh/MocA family oxidoreductase n=1 Tax=Palleronia sediminis TaxID=2547833 RepID=A0A4R6A673_9RHOB|nr:Gfo/Idh/MocA family oxidoreductase [Palleronia sediminis]TDL78252.1 Gfo/Idh/MocA family oxidoreductase [Palleronia sediminis]
MTGADTRPAMGLIGTGPWAETVHAPAIAAHPGLRLAGVWGRDRGKAETLAAQLAVPVFDNAEALFAACDMVALAVSPAAQAVIAPAAARAGCHLLLEKPLAPTAAEGRIVADAIREAGVRAVSFHTLTFLPALVARLGALRDGGDVVAARYDYRSDALVTGPFASSAWRQTRAGALFDIGPHALSMLEPLLGRVTGIACRTLRHARAELRLTHEGGALSEVAIDLATAPDGARLRVDRRDRPPEWIRPEVDTAAAYGRALDALLVRHPDETGARIETALRYVTLLERAIDAAPGEDSL